MGSTAIGTDDPAGAIGPAMTLQPADGFCTSNDASQKPFGAGGTAVANENVKLATEENETAAFGDKTMKAIGFTFVVPIARTRRNALCRVPVDTGCVD
jgi:hypothetical protein